jgi:hypothetical protein
MKSHPLCRPSPILFWPLVSRAALVLISLSILGHAGEPRVKKEDPAIRFWYQFRSAILENNVEKLTALTHFPFETTSPEGGSTRHAKNSFPSLYHPLLDTRIEGQTMGSLMKEKEDLTADERSSLKEGEIEIGSFRFRTIKGKCYFVSATLGKKTPSNLPTWPKPVAQPTEKSQPSPNRKVHDSAIPSAQTRAKKDSPQGVSPSKIDLPPTPSAHRDVFRLFWAQFRQAALDHDIGEIRSLTKFPFETKGPLEEDRKKKYNSREFDLLWPRLLEADPHSWGPLRDSMKALIARRNEPTVEEITTEPTGQVQIGIFIFRKIKDGWYFTRATVAQ